MSGSLAVNAGSTPLGGLLIALMLLPLLAAVVPRWLSWQRGRRVAAGLLLVTALIAAGLAVKLIFSAATGPLELVQPLWRVLAVNQLQLGVGLCLDASAAIFLGGAALLGAWAVCTESPERAGWIGGACLATAVGLQGDSLVLRLAGWEALTVASYLLSQKPNKAALGLGRAGDAMLLCAMALLFWGLSGSWSSSRLDAHYQLDYRPPQEAAAAGAAADASTQTATAPRSTLELPQLRAELHRPSADAQPVPEARAALANKLWLGGRLLRWLRAWFALAAAFKGAAAFMLLWTERHVRGPTRLFLFAAPIFIAAQLLWRLW